MQETMIIESCKCFLFRLATFALNAINSSIKSGPINYHVSRLDMSKDLLGTTLIQRNLPKLMLAASTVSPHSAIECQNPVYETRASR